MASSRKNDSTATAADTLDHPHDELGEPIVRVADLHRHTDPAGYGACSVSGCNCQQYMGSGPTCANCGHQYAWHY